MSSLISSVQFGYIYFHVTDRIYFREDKERVLAMGAEVEEAGGAVEFDLNDGGQTEKKPEKVRSDFPETWIWAQRIAG